ncbi:MAG: MBL fold metallo-hydrolase [Gammaproteobacteria bacterium]|nr:MAG: MBL fold metallo-hydrolase [Gammaproteobacteria bacterium]
MDDFTVGRTLVLAPGVRRVVAPNGGPLTGPGTNSYVLGNGRRVVLDPGPADPAHLERLAGACEGRCEFIMVSHTHPDHSPGAAPLAAALGVPLVGLPPPETGPQDRSFRPERVPADGEVFAFDGFELVAVHTPGHASNHVCWLLRPLDWLFTGDHLMGGSTVVIAPPDGNMNAYLASLQRLKSLPIARLAPGHGPVLEDPVAVVDAVIAHRLRREARVVDALAAAAQPATADDLVARVYADTPVALHPLARLSLQAHLEKLVEDGRAVSTAEGRYRLRQAG